MDEDETDRSFFQCIERMRAVGLPTRDELVALERQMRCSALLPEVGEVFGNFMVHEALLERGAYGLLYRVTRLRDRLPLILKVLRPHLFSEETVCAFQRESEILIACAERGVKGIPLVFGRGVCGRSNERLHYYLMEELSGQSLSELVREYAWYGERFPVPRLLQFMIKLCKTLAPLHHLGVVHRDIKPANIFVQAEAPVLLDFGSAAAPVTLTSRPNRIARELQGTLSTMSPEQARREPPAPAMDVFSLAATMYLVLFDRSVYVKEGEVFLGVDECRRQELFSRRAMAGEIQPLPPREGVSERLREVLEKALAPDPAKRYTSARVFGRALRQVLKRG